MVRRPDGAIVLLEVTPHASNVRNILGKEIAPSAQVQEGYTKVATSRLEAAAKSLPAGVDHKTLVATGDPATEILRVAGEERVDLIAMTTSGAGAWGPSPSAGSSIGWPGPIPARSSSSHRVRRAGGGRLPHPGADRAFVTGIVVPIDGSEAAFAALPVAAALATALGVEIRVVQAVSSDREAGIPAEIAHPDVIEREFRGASRAVAEAAVADAVARLQRLGVTARGEVLTGNPVATVISEAGRGDLVVLTSRGHGKRTRRRPMPSPGAARRVSWTLGGVADKLLRSGTSPVVLVPA